MLKPIQRVGIVGAGAMGQGIAQVCAMAGLEVRLVDQQIGATERALSAIKADLHKAVSLGKAGADQVDAALARLTLCESTGQLAGVQLVVEAIVERLDAKRALFVELEDVVAADAILATNTSSLSVTEIAAACKRPARVAGWHFFNPVPRMKVVEVIHGLRTEAAVLDSLVTLTSRLGHKPVLTQDSPGFVVNHAGRAFVTEGLKMLGERVADHAALDTILRDCAGFRMGPFELLDLTGLDVSHPVMEAIHEQYYGDDRYRPSALARTRLAAGLLGRKSGEGFYRYPRAEAVKSQATEGDTTASVWWPNTGRAAVPSAMALRLDAGSGLRRCEQPGSADWLLLSPIGDDLTQTVADLGLDPRRAIAVDGVFFSDEAVTLMTCPATTTTATGHALRTFGDARFRTTVIADSPGFVAQRVVATVVNLACEMAQQGIATPADIDEAVRLGLGYPQGPFAWGDALGAPTVARILEALYRRFGDPRYRIAPWLARRAALGLSLTTPDR